MDPRGSALARAVREDEVMVAPALPRAFAERPSLATAAALAVALATSAVTTAVSDLMGLTVEASLPTLAFTWIWASWMLRAPLRTPTGKKSRGPWLLAIPLAIANAAASAALLFLLQNATVDASSVASSLLGGLLFGTTVGGIFWLPGLLAVLAILGAPLALARRLRERGVHGRDLGSVVAALAAVPNAAFALFAGVDGWRAQTVPRLLAGIAGPGLVHTVVVVLGLASLLVASVVGAAVLARVVARRRFLAAVARGAVPELRIDAQGDARVLVRVGTEGSYRVPSQEDEVLVAIDPHVAASVRA